MIVAGTKRRPRRLAGGGWLAAAAFACVAAARRLACGRRLLAAARLAACGLLRRAWRHACGSGLRLAAGVLQVTAKAAASGWRRHAATAGPAAACGLAGSKRRRAACKCAQACAALSCITYLSQDGAYGSPCRLSHLARPRKLPFACSRRRHARLPDPAGGLRHVPASLAASSRAAPPRPASTHGRRRPKHVGAGRPTPGANPPARMQCRARVASSGRRLPGPPPKARAGVSMAPARGNMLGTMGEARCRLPVAVPD